MWTRYAFIAALLTVGHVHMVCCEKTLKVENKDKKTHERVSTRLLYGESHGISWTDLELNYRLPSVLMRMYMDVWGLDYHYQRQLLFFSGWDTVWRMNLSRDGPSGSSPEAIAENVGATSISVDWVRDLLYWTCPRSHSVERSDLAGGGRRTVLDNTGKMDRFNNIVLDPYSRYLFLAVEGASVIRSDLEGGDRVAVRLQGHPDKRVVSLAIDTHAKRLFVSTTRDYLPRILSCNYDGSRVQDYDLSEEWWRRFSSISVLHQELFWAHQGWDNRDTVWKANITHNGGLRWQKEYTSRTFILASTNIWSLKVYHPDVQRPGPQDSEYDGLEIQQVSSRAPILPYLQIILQSYALLGSYLLYSKAILYL